MTPEKINAINRKLAEWAGRKHKGCRDCDEGTTDCLEGVSDSDCPYLDEGESWEQCSYAIARQIPDYYRSNAAMDLLGVLVERGYTLEVEYRDKEWSCVIRIPHMNAPRFFGKAPTVPAAICHACLGVAEREGEA